MREQVNVSPKVSAKSSRVSFARRMMGEEKVVVGFVVVSIDFVFFVVVMLYCIFDYYLVFCVSRVAGLVVLVWLLL